MNSALIGYSGYVGSTLLRQTSFSSRYRSTNIGEVDGQIFDTVVCAGAPAQKWLANRDPETDRCRIDGLIAHLKTIRCSCFVLISTVDVFASPMGVDESSIPQEDGLQAYGLNRLRLEKAVSEQFEHHLIVRLPGLVGPGLRKNVIFDLLNDNQVAALDGRSVFQFYPMVNLWADVQIALAAGLTLVHLTAEPVSVSDVAELGFGRKLDLPSGGTPARYDFQTVHASKFGGLGAYQYSARESLQAIRAYAQSEPLAALTVGGQG